MYIWLAIDVDDQLASLRAAAQRVTDELYTGNPALTLPLHISLRISFSVDDALSARAVDRIGRYFAAAKPFSVTAERIERHGSVVWLKITPNNTLRRIHGELIRMMQEEFGVPPHPFDNDFLYHASLFIAPDESTAAAAFPALQPAEYPAELTAGRLILGTSETGRAGEYSVRLAYELRD